MSKKCPYCGSYNTELKVTGNVGYGLVQGARLFTAGVASMAVGLFNRSAAHSVGHVVLHNTERWGESIERHHCCNPGCGKDFI